MNVRMTCRPRKIENRIALPIKQRQALHLKLIRLEVRAIDAPADLLFDSRAFFAVGEVELLPVGTGRRRRRAGVHADVGRAVGISASVVALTRMERRRSIGEVAQVLAEW